jgi:hypothetical protein
VADIRGALAQIEAIHEHLAKSEVYRGWRSVPVAASGAIGLAAAAWQSTHGPVDPETFVRYWIAVAIASLLVGCAEIVWHYAARADAGDRRRTRLVLGQFLPALAAAALVSAALLRLDPRTVAILPGVWSLLFGVAVLSARPYVPTAGLWVAAYYLIAGGALAATADASRVPSPWAVGGVFAVGQAIAAITLYWTLERSRHRADT